MLRSRQPAVVQLQPGRPQPLVLQNLGAAGRKPELPAAALHHGGQPLPDPGDSPAVSQPVHRSVLPAVCAGAVGAGGGTGLRFLHRRYGGSSAPALRQMAYLLRLRHRESHLHGALGSMRRGVVPGEGVLLRLPGAAAADDRCRVCRCPARAGRGTENCLRHCGPLCRQLHGGAPPPGLAGAQGGQRCTPGDPPDLRLPEVGESRPV